MGGEMEAAVERGRTLAAAVGGVTGPDDPQVRIAEELLANPPTGLAEMRAEATPESAASWVRNHPLTAVAAEEDRNRLEEIDDQLEYQTRLIEEVRSLNADQAQTIQGYADKFAQIRYYRDMWMRRAVRLGWHQDSTTGKWLPPMTEDEMSSFWMDRADRLEAEKKEWEQQRRNMTEEIDGLIEAAEYWRNKAGFDHNTDLIPE